MALTVEKPARVNLRATRGDTYRRTFKCVDSSGTAINISGYTARLQIRDAVDGTVLYEGTTTNGHLIVTGAAGTVDLAIPAAATAAWTFSVGVYDMEITSTDGAVTTIAEGTVTVFKDVTKD